MSRAELLKIVNMVFDIGESTDHYISMDYTPQHGITLYIFEKSYDGWASEIKDSIAIAELDDEAIAWISLWTEKLRKERVMV